MKPILYFIVTAKAKSRTALAPGKRAVSAFAVEMDNRERAPFLLGGERVRVLFLLDVTSFGHLIGRIGLGLGQRIVSAHLAGKGRRE